MRVWKRIKVGWDPWWSITKTLHKLKELDENPRGRKGCRRLLGNDTNFVALRCGCPKCQVIHLFYVIPLSMLCFNPANYSLFLLSGFHSFVSGCHKEQPKDVSEIFPPIPLESHQITEESSCLLFLFPLICDARTRPAYTEWRRLHQYYKVVDPLCKPKNLFWFVFFFFFHSFFLFPARFAHFFVIFYQFITTCTLGMGRKRDEGIGNNERVWRWTMMRRLSLYFLDLHGAWT